MENNKRSLLTICIPTYNRSKILEEALEDLLPKIEECDISILILDNASTDDTELIARKYISEKVQYMRNEKNIGGDANILKSYVENKKKSEYICVLGDSYRCPRSLVDICRILETRKYDTIILNRKFKTLGNLVPREYYNTDTVVSELGGMMDLTGTIIIRSEGVKEEYYTPFMWSNFIHTCMVFSYWANLSNPNIYFAADFCLDHTKIDKINTSWYKKQIEIFAKNWVIAILMVHGVSIDAKLECIKKHDEITEIFHFKSLLKSRINNDINYKDVRKYKAYIPFVSNVPLWQWCMISIMYPYLLGFLLKIFKCIKNSISSYDT